MDREQAKKYLPIVTALSEGKIIQKLSVSEEWIDVDNPMLFNDSVYRIKPEPLETWINVYRNGLSKHYFNNPVDAARDFDQDSPSDRMAVHMMEVTDE